MAIQKRKAVARNAQEALGGTTRAKGTKRTAEEAASAAAEEVEEPEQQDEEMEEAPEEISEEDRVAREEKETAAARAKELKGMPASDLKDMVLGKGLDAGKKEDNVAAILGLEAKARADKRAQEARQRSVVVKKKEELEALPFPELSERCRLAGILGKLTKQERVQQLMIKWQQDDGISKGLAAMATEERQAELSAMDSAGLATLCASAGADPLLKEVMVDRLIKHEGASGRFARPIIPEEDDGEETTSKQPKADLVDAVLANESSRKKQRDLQKKQEEAESSKRKELQAKSVEELKKMVVAKGREGAGKKGELVDVLMAISAEEEATAARRGTLRALGPDELRKMLASRKVEFAKNDKKDAMIEALFAHEAKTRKELELHEARAQEVESKKREKLKALSAAELKDMCSAKGLKLGTAKDDRIATLLAAARADGEVDRLVAAAVREVRKEELMAMDKVALKALCDSAGLDVIVKDVVVERLLSHEAEHGRTTPADESKDGKPPAKKARTGKK